MEVIRSHQIAVLALLASIRAYYSLARRGSLGAYASTLKNFKELGVSAKLIKALSVNKIVTPTEVQRVAIVAKGGSGYDSAEDRAAGWMQGQGLGTGAQVC